MTSEIRQPQSPQCEQTPPGDACASLMPSPEGDNFPSAAVLPLLPLPAELPPPRPWGFWATAGWTVLIVITQFVVQLVALIPFVIARLSQAGADAQARESILANIGQVALDGTYASVAVIASAAACVALIALAIRVRRCSFVQYVGLVPLRLKQVLVCVPFLAAVYLGSCILAGSDAQSGQFMTSLFKAPGSMALLIFALVAVAPFYEEIIFRGFVFKGIASVRYGSAAAVLLPSLLFAAIHLQYGQRQMLVIFVLGIFFGVVRLATGSLSLTILLHSLVNATAVAFMIFGLQ